MDLCFSISSLGIALNKGFFEKRSFGLFLGVCAVTAQGGREQKNELTVWEGTLLFTLLRLQIFVFVSYIDDARTVLVGVQVVVTDYQGAGVTPVQIFK